MRYWRIFIYLYNIKHIIEHLVHVAKHTGHIFKIQGQYLSTFVPGNHSAWRPINPPGHRYKYHTRDENCEYLLGLSKPTEDQGVIYPTIKYSVKETVLHMWHRAHIFILKSFRWKFNFQKNQSRIDLYLNPVESC